MPFGHDNSQIHTDPILTNFKSMSFNQNQPPNFDSSTNIPRYMAPSPPLSESSGFYNDHNDTYQMDIDSHHIAPFVQLSNLPPKGKIHSLIREESRAIPIPGRAQSHDDIRMLRGTPPKSPGRYSPSRYIICGSPGSPPIGHYGPQLIAGAGGSASRNAFSYSQVVSPLSSSVPTGGGGSNRLANWKCPLSHTKKK